MSDAQTLLAFADEVAKRAAKLRRAEAREKGKLLRAYYRLHRNWRFLTDVEKRRVAKLVGKLGLAVDVPPE